MCTMEDILPKPLNVCAALTALNTAIMLSPHGAYQLNPYVSSYWLQGPSSYNVLVILSSGDWILELLSAYIQIVWIKSCATMVCTYTHTHTYIYVMKYNSTTNETWKPVFLNKMDTVEIIVLSEKVIVCFPWLGATKIEYKKKMYANSYEKSWHFNDCLEPLSLLLRNSGFSTYYLLNSLFGERLSLKS